jgi:hypothetical protein
LLRTREKKRGYDLAQKYIKKRRKLARQLSGALNFFLFKPSTTQPPLSTNGYFDQSRGENASVVNLNGMFC